MTGYLSNAELASRVAALVDAWRVREDEYSAWLAGTPDGGPDGDGKYPLTDPDGVTRVVECPAKLASMTTGPSGEANASAAAALLAEEGAVEAKDAAQDAVTAAQAAAAVATTKRDEALQYRNDTAADKAAVQALKNDVSTDALAVADWATQVTIDKNAVAATAATLSSLSMVVANSRSVYANAYATALPRGVRSLSSAGIGTGSGGTPGTYAGGVSGGPTGFAWEYVIGSDGKVASYTITNPGLSSATTAPTLTYPSGGLTGATVPVATVSPLFGTGEAYWAATSDSRFVALWQNTGSATPAAVNNPNGSQVSVPNSVAFAAMDLLVAESRSRISVFRTAPASTSALNRIVAITLVGASNAVDYHVSAFFRDDAGSGGSERFQFWLTRTSDSVRVASLNTSGSSIAGAGLAGVRSFALVPNNGSGISGLLTVDFGTDEGDGEGPAFSNVTSGPLFNDRVMFDTAQVAAISAAAAAEATNRYNNAVIRPFVTMPTSASSVTAQGAFAVTRITINPLYPLGAANVMLRECGRRSSDSFFRAQIATYDGVSTSTVLAATNNNNALNATGYVGLMVLPLTAQAGNTLGIAAGTVIGEIEVDFGTGASFGSYATALTWAEGALIKSRIQTSTAITEGLIKSALQNYSASPFLSTVNDDYLRTIVEDLVVDFGVQGRTYVLNYRSDTAGSTRRLQFFLYDPVRGANVAAWTDQKDYDWSSEVPESVYLSGAALGGIRSDYGIQYTGAGCTVFIKPGSVQFNKGASAFTTTAAGGINPNRVWSPEETERRIMNGQGLRNKLRTYGPGGDFASLKLAVDSLLKPGLGSPDNVQRSWWPFSDLCTPAHQWTLQAMPGHSEVKPAVIPSGVGFARGILCWMGMTIRLRSDTVIKGERTGGVDTYAIDFNLGGRIIMDPGALIWADSGVAVHQDAANALSVPSVANGADKTAGTQFFRIIGLLVGGRYRSTLQAWSCGISDGQRLVFRECIFETTGTGTNWSTHTSPNNLTAGYYEFDDVTLVGGTKSISLVTSNPVVARHGIRVANSDVTSVNAADSGAGYVRLGKQPGVTYSIGLEP